MLVLSGTPIVITECVLKSNMNVHMKIQHE